MSGNAEGAAERSPRHPWSSDARSAACNFAFGDLFNNLPQLAVFDGHLHVPTLAAAAGAIAGYSAQCALRSEHGGWPAGMQVATTKSGAQFFFGDPLNNALIAHSAAEGPLRAWSMIAGAAVAVGVQPPPLEPMFAHVSAAIGEDRGFYPATAVAPRLPGLELLKRVWPLACDCFEGRLSGKVMRDEAATPQIWRPVIAAHVAHHGLRRTQASLDPATGVAIAFESAIYASKIDPKLVDT